ncbi:MAG TPA: bifunctional 5,10-methylenetetrahydrofolate dehydrogenase/5,10-methenyltetrahydrofolate cyclohydrolase [bacterium]|uniref:Bifunctional protein FolD n=1 Tax=candidate division TA06 bacterium ADurb.Bin417 TaxID=1852828 RepID=A0A1V5MKV7_UNCT6|nr:MAG: Bifunctional protein FolD protein [candidate division TA06 bacterium ADurb.Bin417]HNQ35997.1 bifunctional 5,10-methylenetetrahydrofolate dehydrogenase/5,10-methenyltetrahydrofolate cyclohydrolase [bacterium]HNS48529.1 bifunctional 5,10-methylenetetrahydrofolate dehydrogenase/5,10-methenyltetrahydrofolate cyclohydrolase [bacterium]
MAQLLEGKLIAERLRNEAAAEAAELKKSGVVPKLVAVQAGENPASAVYLKSQKNQCAKVGLDYELRTCPADIGQAELAAEIERLNQDRSVNGIILQMPLPGQLDGRKLQAAILPEKDVEGITPANLGRLVLAKPRFVPCTAAGVMELLKSTGDNLYGKEAVVVGHSEIVGKPLALLLLAEFVTVSVCHIATGERGHLADHVGRAEILVVAVGKAGLIKGEWIQKGATVIDVGINRVGDKLVGDVEFEAAAERAARITPVPGGVGPLTVAMLIRNTVLAARAALG